MKVMAASKSGMRFDGATPVGAGVVVMEALPEHGGGGAGPAPLKLCSWRWPARPGHKGPPRSGLRPMFERFLS